MPAVPTEFHDLFETDTLAHVTTLHPDGAPHTTPVWVDYDAADDRLLVNTERGRRKVRNVRNDPRVALSMTAPDDPYRWLSITGEVDEFRTDGARDHIDELARRYTDADEYQNPIRTERVVLAIEPEDVNHSGA